MQHIVQQSIQNVNRQYSHKSILYNSYYSTQQNAAKQPVQHTVQQSLKHTAKHCKIADVTY